MVLPSKVDSEPGVAQEVEAEQAPERELGWKRVYQCGKLEPREAQGVEASKHTVPHRDPLRGRPHRSAIRHGDADSRRYRRWDTTAFVAGVQGEERKHGTGRALDSNPHHHEPGWAEAIAHRTTGTP